jgi:signal peptidase I
VGDEPVIEPVEPRQPRDPVSGVEPVPPLRPWQPYPPVPAPDGAKPPPTTPLPPSGNDGPQPEPAQDIARQRSASSAAANEIGRKSRRQRKQKKAPWWELPVLIAVAVAVAVLIKTFLVQPFYIPSESMETTLHGCDGCSGDRIIVNKPIYDFRDPHPGDIVVFRAPTERWFNEPVPETPTNPILKGVRWFGQLIGVVPPDEHDLVKRVIAVGGQTIQCCDASGNVQVSDHGAGGPWRSLDEPYVSSQPDAAAVAFGPVTVPNGRLWVMGDNRAHSEDSRWHYLNDYRNDAVDSTVPTSMVVGKAVIIAWPPSRWRTLGTPATFKAAAAAALPLGVGVVAAPVLVRRRTRRQPRRWGRSRRGPPRR